MSAVADLDTPVPLVELPRLERNIARMAERIGATGARHRPHVKTHKTRHIAALQQAAGADGLTVAKLGEAEAFADAGFPDLFIAYPLIGEAKLRRLAMLMRRVRVSSTVDSLAGAQATSRVMLDEGMVAELVLEVEAGSGRTGVPADEAVELADRIGELPGVGVTGVMTFAPGYVEGIDAQRAMGQEEGALAVEVATRLRASGHDIGFVTAGCTPTSPWAAGVPGVTHVRAGNYVFHDRKQLSMGNATLDDCALTVLATVVSAPIARRYVVDAGIKTLAGEDYGWGTNGQLLEHPDVVLSWAAEEHGVIDVPDDVEDPGFRVGDRVRIIPNHACGVPNMHDELVVVDGERVVDRWPVIARGRVR